MNRCLKERIGRKLFLFLLFLPAASAAFARSVVDTVRIEVDLKDNGDAAVTEVWNIDVDSEISEWYLVAGNLDKMDISGLGVRDESGLEFVNEGEWDVNRSREEKAGRCGLVSKSDGYEICWGVGSSGWHSYIVTYDLSGLVKGYSDKDGFNYMFVARNLGTLPDYIELTIKKEGASFDDQNAAIWGFGYKGDIVFEDGRIVARTSEPFSKESGMIALVGFNKGIFTPEIQEGGLSFDDVRSKALEGSDYRKPEKSAREILFVVLEWLLVAFVFLFFPILMLNDRFKIKRRKKELLGGNMKDVPWFRDVPVKGDLGAAFDILDVFDSSSASEENLISAYLTRLFYRKAFVIVSSPDGKPLIQVQDFPVSSDNMDADTKREYDLFAIFKEAAGADGILQKKELQKWFSRNEKTAYDWRLKFEKGPGLAALKSKDVQEVFGLRRFLKDFTLIEDRGVVEVGLWNNYLVFASLYGIADQLRKDFNKVCPEYYQLSQTAASLSGAGTFVIWDDIHYMSRNFNMAASSYASSVSSASSGSSSWSGGGGGASFGGGGGFSGGGSGGGGR